MEVGPCREGRWRDLSVEASVGTNTIARLLYRLLRSQEILKVARRKYGRLWVDSIRLARVRWKKECVQSCSVARTKSAPFLRSFYAGLFLSIELPNLRSQGRDIVSSTESNILDKKAKRSIQIVRLPESWRNVEAVSKSIVRLFVTQLVRLSFKVIIARTDFPARVQLSHPRIVDITSVQVYTVPSVRINAIVQPSTVTEVSVSVNFARPKMGRALRAQEICVQGDMTWVMKLA